MIFHGWFMTGFLTWSILRGTQKKTGCEPLAYDIYGVWLLLSLLTWTKVITKGDTCCITST
jgi:hypothetical protein